MAGSDRKSGSDGGAKAWSQVRRIAQKSFELHNEAVDLPAVCLYTLEQVLDPDFLP
jgi:hypothetical protein